MEKANPLSCIRRIRDKKRETNAAKKHNATKMLISVLSTENSTLEIKLGTMKQSAKLTTSDNSPGIRAVLSSAAL
ncbi:hypothetical protein D9M68_871220 [compost metagenome]